MALDFKKLVVRTLSALVYSVLLLGSLLWNYYSFTVFFFMAAMLCLREFYNLMEKMEARPFRTVGYIAGTLLYISFINISYVFKGENNILFPFLACFPFIIFLRALFSRREMPFQAAVFTIAGLIYAVLPFALMHELVFIPDILDVSRVYYPKIVFGIILLIWINDTFAYLGGSLFGRHKLLERISPAKTWEGTIFGALATLASGFLIRSLLFGQSFDLFVVLGLIVPVLAIFGDLLESMLKRHAGVKDSGNLMPGHGGMLDRLDSLIFVLPFLFVLLKLIPMLANGM